MLRLAALLCLIGARALALDCESVSFQDASYTYCEVDMASDDLRLFRADSEGAPLGSFRAIGRLTGRKVLFAMNAGMFHSDLRAVGYYVEEGRQQMRLVTNAGPGNFGLLPNGVLCIREGRADVIETIAFRDRAPACRFATQSGPMLVIDGKLHPRLLPDGTSRYIRNGVGTSADGRRAVFVISDEAVNFHAFASFFRDYLNLPQALYLDGKVSRLFAPQVGRDDVGFAMGPMVAVLQ